MKKEPVSDWSGGWVVVDRLERTRGSIARKLGLWVQGGRQLGGKDEKMSSEESGPPAPLPRTACARVARARERVGASARDAWHRATCARDPVMHLRREHAHLNRASFKLREIVARLVGGDASPRRAVFLAEAPGGFLHAARVIWPHSELRAMSHEGPGAIPFDETQRDGAIVRGLPHGADLRHAAVEDAVVERCGGEGGADFISADGGTECDDLTVAEQNATRLVLAETATALRLQAPAGHLVLKIFEGSTLVTRELFEVLRSLYARTMLFKPLTSRAANSERYVVALGLRDASSARVWSRRLREHVDRTDGGYVHTLGVGVSDAVHGAFDTMAERQAACVDELLGAMAQERALPAIRAAARREFRALQRLLGKRAASVA